MYVNWKLVLVCLQIVLISAQDRRTICAECTIGVETISGAPNGTPRYVGQVEPISIHLEIVLN
jgi:hypothetical protein